MKKIAYALCFSLMSFINPPKKLRIVFLGDSITQAGVGKNGYITKIDSLIKQEGLTENYELIGAGIGGNKIYDLYLRLETDVLDKNPDWVVIYVGVNDVWHKTTSGTGTDADKFEKFYRAIIKKIQDKGAKVIVCTPALIGEKNDWSNQQDGDLNRYSGIIRNMAQSLSIPIIDLRKATTDFLQANNPQNVAKGILTTDGVHLSVDGNIFVAKLMWNTIHNNTK